MFSPHGAGRTLLLFLLFSLGLAPATAQEVIDPAVAEKDPDFLIQGEYQGKGMWPGGEAAAMGAQVVALGDHRFQVVVYRGGLPGEGWKRGDDRLRLEGELADETTALVGAELEGVIANQALVLKQKDGSPVGTLKRIERRSPTLADKPPQGAVVLFDGSSAENFQNGKLTDMQTLDAGCSLKEKYKIARLHLEFRLSWKPKASGQGRSNSGVHLAGIPEIQVLDSFGLEGAKNECGAFYSRREPDVNACLPPLVWQTYDVEYQPPQGEGNVLVTVRHNGIVVHKNFDTGRKQIPASGLSLQAHGNHVQYRNLWIVKASE